MPREQSDDDSDASAEAPPPAGADEAARMVRDDVFGLKGYRVNAPPVTPFALDAADPVHQLLAAVFEPGGWRIDTGTGRESKNQAVILRQLAAQGKSSLYATAKCRHSGVTALHACAINGYLDLLMALVDQGRVDVLDVAEGLNALFDSKSEKSRGADALWMAKRRGHKPIVEYLLAIPEVKASLGAEFLDRGRAEAHRQAQLQARRDAIAGALRGLAGRAQQRRDREATRGEGIHVGDRVRVFISSSREPAAALVRFRGPVGYTDGVMVGVELEGPCGKHDGTVKGREYFRCPPQHGLMLAPSDVVLDHRRADGETRDLAPVDVLPRTQQPVLAYLYQD